MHITISAHAIFISGMYSSLVLSEVIAGHDDQASLALCTTYGNAKTCH